MLFEPQLRSGIIQDFTWTKNAHSGEVKAYVARKNRSGNRLRLLKPGRASVHYPGCVQETVYLRIAAALPVASSTVTTTAWSSAPPFVPSKRIGMPVRKRRIARFFSEP